MPTPEAERLKALLAPSEDPDYIYGAVLPLRQKQIKADYNAQIENFIKAGISQEDAVKLTEFIKESHQQFNAKQTPELALPGIMRSLVRGAIDFFDAPQAAYKGYGAQLTPDAMNLLLSGPLVDGMALRMAPGLIDNLAPVAAPTGFGRLLGPAAGREEVQSLKSRILRHDPGSRQQIIAEGKDARLAGKKMEDNPYPIPSVKAGKEGDATLEAHELWADGFMDEDMQATSMGDILRRSSR